MIKVDHTLESLEAQLGELAKQARFTLSLALNRTAKDAQAHVKDTASKRLTIRGPHVPRGIRIKPGSKTNLEAEVGSIDPFMARQAEGGNKAGRGGVLGLGRGAVAVPQVGPGMPRSTERSKTPPKKWPGAYLKKRNVVLIKDAQGAAIYRKVGKGKKERLVGPIYLLRRRVKVRKKWYFKEGVAATVRKRFEERLAEAMDKAVATAKRRKG